MLNDLTKRLYAEGWTREKHPDNVCWGDFENFSYKREYLQGLVWETPCGLLVEGRTVGTSDVSYNGVWYCPENGNPVIRCPHSRRDCEHQTAELARYCMCVCSRSERKYSFDESAEKAERDADAKAKETYMELTGGAYCINVVNANGYTPGRYKVEFDPDRCIRYGCTNPVCCITKKERDLQKVNVFYDIRREWSTRSGLIEDHKVKIEKGCKVFPRAVARTDAELWLARRKAEYNPFQAKHIIDPHLTPEDRSQEFFSKHHRQWPGFDYFEFWYSVENIRIEAKEQRDLLQDLRDVADGLEVVHAADSAKAQEQAKKDAKKKREAEKIRKTERGRLKAFEEHWDDPTWKRAFQNWFGEDYAGMIKAKEEELAGIGAQLDLFSGL